MAHLNLCVTVAFVVAISLSWALPAHNETERVDYTGHQLVSVTPTNPSHVSLLSHLVDRLQLDVWQEAQMVGASALLRLRPEVVAEFVATTSRSGITVTTTCSNLQDLIDNELNEMRFTTYSTSTLRFERYLKFQEFKNALKQYAKKYDHVTYTSIGRSYESRDMIGVHIKAKENLPIVFLECGIHAREWISHSTCLYIIDQLATQYDKDEDIRRLVSKYEWRIYPIVNPDGYEYTHTTDRLWRKTRSKSRFSNRCRGADANRNFDVGTFCRVRSSENPCTDTYCGDSPFSEPETRAIREAVMDTRGRTEFYFSFHSFGLLWMFPYAYSDALVPEYDQLLNISLRAKEAIRNVRGTTYTVGPISTTIYQVAGSSIDWAYERAGIKKSFALELQPSWLRFQGQRGFMLPAKDILPTVQETWEGVKAAIA
ncbi:hypothetical protein V5799_026624 [Amblyomma americanum]|uniref:Peptidase M14 domain-containing protein n=1 Tax=Amblyomma americanum TaxID=6943 RepID=A0AAQ4DI21_AMBAM